MAAVYDEFVRRVAERAAARRGGADAGADYGPITMPGQLEVIRRHIDAALAAGGRAVVGGPESVRAPYVQPVVLVDVPHDNPANQDETFGPTITITKVRDIDEAVALANDTRYGLGAAVFSAKRGRGDRRPAGLRDASASIRRISYATGAGAALRRPARQRVRPDPRCRRPA